MPDFLSSNWIQELDRAVRTAAGVSALAPIVIEQVVSDVPRRGEVRYRICVADDGVARVDECFSEEEARPADVRLSTDYRTAVAIARGSENAQIALAHGRLRLGGDVEALVRRSAALGALDDATATLRAGTTYPSP